MAIWYGLFARAEEMDSLFSYFLAGSLYNAGLFYGNAYSLLPKLLTRHRWPLYLLALVAVVIVSYYVKQVMMANLAFDVLVQGWDPWTAHMPTVFCLTGSFIYYFLLKWLRRTPARYNRPGGRVQNRVR
jgi:hypothetical protein